MALQGNVEDYDQSIIKTLREHKKWSRRELAEKSGITQQTILNVEQNRYPASLSTITSLIHALGIDFSRYVNISHRYKSTILDEHNIILDPNFDHSIRFYQYHGYYIGHLYIGEPIDNLRLARLPYFNVFTYVLSGRLDLNIDGEDFSITPHKCISLSGLSQRTVTIKERCSLVIILKNKCKLPHSHNPLEDLSTILKSYPKNINSDKDVSICKEDMDFSFIKHLRNSKNMSLDTMAEASGLSTSAISLIENNKRAPSLATISAISNVLNETTVNLFTLAQKIPTCLNVPEPRNQHIITNSQLGLRYNYLTYHEDTEITSNPDNSFCLELHIPIAGEMDISVEDGDFTVCPGKVMAFDNMRPHQYMPKRGYTGLSIELPKSKITTEHH